jgi:hypothetical protein
MFLQANHGISAAVLGDTVVGSVPAVVGGPSVQFFSKQYSWVRRGVGLYLHSAESSLAGKQQINSSLKVVDNEK